MVRLFLFFTCNLLALFEQLIDGYMHLLVDLMFPGTSGYVPVYQQSDLVLNRTVLILNSYGAVCISNVFIAVCM